MAEFHFDPDGYLELMAGEVPDYARVQEEAAGVTVELASVRRVLDLGTGTGTGETARRVLARHPDAALVGVDASEAMLSRAQDVLPDSDLRVARLEDPLPAGPFDLAVSALAVHHLPGSAKAELFSRIADALRPAGGSCLPTLSSPPIRPTRSPDRWHARRAKSRRRAA